jgi:hypothetical protein
VTHAVDANLYAFMHQAILMHVIADARFVEQVHGDLLDDAGADPTEHVFGGLPLEDDVVDALSVQQLAEQQSRRTGADDGDLSAHRFPFMDRRRAAGADGRDLSAADRLDRIGVAFAGARLPTAAQAFCHRRAGLDPG